MCIMKFRSHRHDLAQFVMSLSYQGTTSLSRPCTQVVHAHSSSMTPESTGTTRRRTGIFIIYSVLFTSGTPSCTPHRHTRERSSNRWWHMPTDSTIPNLLWRLDIACMCCFWGASPRVPGMDCLPPRPGIAWLAQLRFGAVHLWARLG